MFVWEGHIFIEFRVIFGSFTRINLRDPECQIKKKKILQYSSHQTQVCIYYEEDFLLFFVDAHGDI